MTAELFDQEAVEEQETVGTISQEAEDEFREWCLLNIDGGLPKTDRKGEKGRLVAQAYRHAYRAGMLRTFQLLGHGEWAIQLMTEICEEVDAKQDKQGVPAMIRRLVSPGSKLDGSGNYLT